MPQSGQGELGRGSVEKAFGERLEEHQNGGAVGARRRAADTVGRDKADLLVELHEPPGRRVLAGPGAAHP